MKYFNGFSFLLILFCISAGIFFSGCMSPTIKLFTDASDPLKEFVLEGDGNEKILIIPVYGIISDVPESSLLGNSPSIVQDIVSQLKLAESDPDLKAVIFKIDSPGGSVTASDILYHEIKSFKERTGVKVTAVIMNVAASGGYYMALPADFIMAHPTSVTGSVGVIFLQPKFYGLMDKIGVAVKSNTSGKQKDMGSPFRKATIEEDKIFQGLTDALGKRFTDLVIAHRQISPEVMKDVASARIYLAAEALTLGLIDEIGYIEDAVVRTKALAAIDANSRVIVYRRVEYPNDNMYNTQSRLRPLNASVVDLGLPDTKLLNRTGFYYLWPFGAGIE